MSDKLKIGVMGAGVFGGYHAGKFADHPHAHLTGIYDPHPERAIALALANGTQAYTDRAAFLAAMDAVIIAVPATHHGREAIAALNAGCHILVEKPVATDITTAESMIRLAAQKSLVLQVGHQERFVLEKTGLRQVPALPIWIEGRRMSMFSSRNMDVSVTLDLMIHDLDLVLWIIGETPQSISGSTQIVCGPDPDASLAFLQFDKTRVRLEASRIEAQGARTLQLIYPEGEVLIDFNAKTLSHNTPFDLDENFGDHTQVKDSLGAADHAFVEAITQRKPGAITGEDGLAALRAALTIDGKL